MNPIAGDSSDHRPRVVIIGAGFGGLTAALVLAKAGYAVTVVERDTTVGGLAGSFSVGGVQLEKFYHHWFTNDAYVNEVVRELGTEEDVLLRETRTGMYYSNKVFRLSTPMDLLRFRPLGLVDRVRLGMVALQARRTRDWRSLESLTAEKWLRTTCGDRVFEVVWEPLLRGKFGRYASDVSAVWFWNKLKLRGGSRGKGGAEQLAYYRGGFAALAERLADEIAKHGGRILTGSPVEGIEVADGVATGVTIRGGSMKADAIIATPALPIIADLLEGRFDRQYVTSLRRIRYLANVCIVLEMNRSLSQTYWLNVNDPSFPFVGIIEHTNFEPATTYGGRHIVYLSKYLPEDDDLYRMSDDALLDFCLPFIQRMFPAFSRDWVVRHHVWRARFSQPIVERHYSRLIPSVEAPLRSLFLCSMAQVYPEDRGTNYAIREGRRVAALVDGALRRSGRHGSMMRTLNQPSDGRGVSR